MQRNIQQNKKRRNTCIIERADFTADLGQFISYQKDYLCIKRLLATDLWTICCGILAATHAITADKALDMN